jgi:hypothetical protein
MAMIAAVILTSCGSSKPVANNNPQYTYSAPPQAAPAPTPVTAKSVTANSEPEIEEVLPCSDIDSDLEHLRIASAVRPATATATAIWASALLFLSKFNP